MRDNHRFEQLPLDTPDDDPRWEAYQDIFSFGFMGRRPNEASVNTMRKQARGDRSFMDMITATGPGLDGPQPVAAFVSAPFTMNAGAGIVDCLVIQGIAVRPSHRRKGILRHMMRHRLDAARDSGFGSAVLTASEGSIYGRYGFGIATRQLGIEIDTTRFRIRDGVELAPGSLEFVHPSFLADHFGRISLAHQQRYRGSHGRLEEHRMVFTGAWDRKEEGPSRALRALVHFDIHQQPDGFAVFTQRGWESTPITSDVLQICSPDPAIDRSLWQALVDIDLVENLTYDFSHNGDPLSLSLVDSRAVAVKNSKDAVWLRILDLPHAVAERGFESEGTIVVHLEDPLGYCSGTWRITASGGDGHAAPTTAEPDVSLGVDSLATLWFGDRTAATLAQAGLVHGGEEHLRRFSQMFETSEAPVNLSDF